MRILFDGYSSNMNIIVTVISIIINSMGGVILSISHSWRKKSLGGLRVEFVHMKRR